LILDFEFDQHLESHKHVISLIMGFRDTGCYNMTLVEESRPIIWDQPETYNPWVFLSGNEKTYVWTSLWVYRVPRAGMTQYW
jgi:hypothetical protein